MRGWLVGGLMALVVVTGAAQTPPVPTVVPKDELVDAWIARLRDRAEVANAACQGLEAVKRYDALRTEIVRKIEAKYPGYTLGFPSLTLVVKAK